MASDVYLKLGDIKGESTDSDHGDEIEVLAWSWAMSQSGTMHSGTGGGGGKVSVQDISVTKYADLSSVNIMTACSKGSHIGKAVLTVRKAGDKPLEYLMITMENVLVTSYATGGTNDGNERLTENISLNFSKVQVDYKQQGDDGKAKGGVVSHKWDIAKNATF